MEAAIKSLHGESQGGAGHGDPVGNPSCAEITPGCGRDHSNQGNFDAPGHDSPYPFEHISDRVGIDPLPIRAQLKHRRQRMVWRYEHESDIVSFQHSIPSGLHFHELSIGLEQILAIKVTSPVHEDFRAARKTVDDIPYPPIFCEHAVV